jgi:transposase
VCPHDGARLTEIGVEATEQLDFIPQQVRVIRHERVKYAFPCCDQSLRLTPAPVRITYHAARGVPTTPWYYG